MEAADRLKTRSKEKLSLTTLGLFFLCLLLGLYLGRAASNMRIAEVSPELNRYLSNYVQTVPAQALSVKHVLQTMLVYFRYPLLAFALGFASFGVLMIPVLATALAFSFSYSVCCFTVSFGSKGMLLSLALFGLRYLLTLPCFLILAEQSFRSSLELAGYTLGYGGRRGAELYGGRYFTKFLTAAAVLLTGALLDLWLTPWLLQMIAV